MADWSLLPSSLVDSVAGFLSAADQAAMAATSNPWREAMAGGLCRRRPKLSDWIIVQKSAGIYETPNGMCQFASFSEGMRRSYFFPVPSEKLSVIGSCQGWLMLQDMLKLSRVLAFNPVSRSTVEFPTPPRVPIWKVVFSPQRPPVAAIFQKSIWHKEPQPELYFSYAGDDGWTPLPAPAGSLFEDIALHEGKLCALETMNQIVIFDLDREKLSYSVIPYSRPAMPHRHSSVYSDPIYRKHIGVVSNQLAILHCSIGSVWRLHPDSIPLFEVSRLQSDGEVPPKWVATGDLAGHAIFHDFDRFTAIKAEDDRELQANCIYYVQDCVNQEILLTMTNVMNGTVIEIPQSVRSYSMRVWFHPSS